VVIDCSRGNCKDEEKRKIRDSYLDTNI
jgi:hypothetical protein